MKKRFIAFPVLLFILVSCKGDPEKEFNKLLLSCKTGVENSIIDSALINVISKKMYPIKNVKILDNVIVSNRDKDELEIEFPFEWGFKNKLIFESSNFFINKKYFVFGNEYFISFIDLQDDSVAKKIINDPKGKISSFILVENNIFYLKGKKLYFYNLMLSNNSVINETIYTTPSKKYYKTKIFVNDNILGIVRGIPGTYFLSLINYKTKNSIINNVSLSSKKIFFNKKFLYYIHGGSGHWGLYRYNLHNKIKHLLKVFKDLSDIEFFQNGYMALIKNKTFFSEYGKNETKLSQKIKFGRKFGKDAILIYDKRYHIVDFKKLKDKILVLKTKCPRYFN